MNTKQEFISAIDGLGATYQKGIAGLQERIETLEAVADRPKGNSQGMGQIETKAFESFLRSGNKQQLMEAKVMSIGSDAAGGYTHIAQLATEILSSVAQINPLMKECNKVVIDSNKYSQIYTTTRTTSARAAESGTRNASSTPIFKRTDVNLFDLFSLPQITNELLNSSQFDLSAWIKSDITGSFDDALGSEFITGNGSTQCVGLLAYMSTHTPTSSPELPWGTLRYVTGSGSPEKIAYNSLLDVIAALPGRYKAAGNCKWYMSTSAIEDTRKLLDTANLPIWRQDFGVAGSPMVLLGYPVIETPQLDGQSYRVLFGDMRQAYCFVSHSRGLGFLVDQISSPGFTRYYASLQCGAAVMDSRAMVALRAK